MSFKKNVICFFNSNKEWGGGEKWHHDFLCKLNHAGYPVLAITHVAGELGAKLARLKCLQLQIRVRNLSFINPVKVFRVYLFLKRNNVKTVILGLPADIKLGGIAAKMAGVNKIIYRRGSAIPVRNHFLNRFIFKKVLTDVIVNSREIKKNVLINNPGIIDEHKIHIIYNSVEISDFQQISYPSLDYSENGKEIYLGNAGRFVEQKGQHFLFKIAEQLNLSSTPFRMLIAGKGPLEKKLKAETKRLGFENQIIFTDFVQDMNNWFRKIDLFLLPSLHEGTANVVLEAMAACKPVIAFNLSSMPELIEDGQTGYLVNFGDVNGFVEKIAFLYRNKSLIKILGENARNKVARDFNSDNALAQLINMVQ